MRWFSPQASLVWANGRTELYSVAAVHLHLPCQQQKERLEAGAAASDDYNDTASTGTHLYQ